MQHCEQHEPRTNRLDHSRGGIRARIRLLVSLIATAALRERLAGPNLCPYYSTMDEETANRIIDLQAEITALRGAVRMLLHNVYNANDSALAILREKAFQTDKFQVDDDGPNERSARYREGVREAVASLLDPFQPDNDEASRLANPAPKRAKSSDRPAPDPDLS